MTEKPENIIKLKRIQIKTESGSKWFKSGQDFITWINEQRSFYSFLSTTRSQHGEREFQSMIDQSWNAILQPTQNELARFADNPESYAQQVDSIVDIFQQNLTSKRIFTSDAPFFPFVKELVEEDKVKAAFTLAYFLNYNLSNWGLISVKGTQAAIDWERDCLGRVEYEDNALKVLRDDWGQEFREQSENVEKSQARVDRLSKRADDLISAQQKRFDSSIESYDARLEKATNDANDELNNITRTYDENLALYSSVRYWGLQEKYHKRMSIGFGLATVVVTCLVSYGLYFYADKFLANVLANIHVSKLVTIAVITTFGIWLVRTCAILFMSHTHLRTDAQERRTMMHTYLALLRKGQGPKDDERQLILQTLFRPSTTGMIKEDAGPSSVVDLLNRLTPGSSGTK